MIRRLLEKLFGIEEPPPYDQDAADAAREEVLRRTYLTGRAHVANQRRDGSWEIQEVSDAR